jgi:ankyrin repeat protein
MPVAKSQLVLLFITILMLSGGAYYWFRLRETPDDAMQKLAAQNIDVTGDAFLAEIKAAHMENIHYFLLAGAGPGTQNQQDGTSALMVAADSGNKAVLAALLAYLQTHPEEAAKDLNLQDTANQKTALIVAVEKGDPDIVSQLLAYGADTSVTDKTGETPLIVAVRHNNLKLLPILIAADAAQHQGASINLQDMGGETPLTYAIRGQNADIVDALIKAKADAVSADRSGVTPLMVAAEVGNEAIGARLLAAGAKLDTADRAGNTPLTTAIRHAHPAFARMLLDKGAGVDFHTTGPLPLQAAVSAEPFDAPLFNYLLAHSKDAVTIDASLVFDAIDHKNADLVKALLDRNINAKATNAKGETLLYHAIENGLEDSALLLIDKGADIYQTGIPGMTPLERATKHNESKVVKKLLSLGVSPDQKTSEGYTIAEMAVYSGYPEILDALLAKGAKLEKDFGVLWSIRDGGGRSVPVLLKYGAKPTVMSNSGDPALWLAASAGEVEAVEALIKYHTPVDVQNTAQGMTPLAIASHGGQLAVVKLLVEAGANLETADAFGMTPLAHAAYMTKPDVVEYLISKGANVHASDKQGRSITDLAALGEASSARDRVITLLQQKR